MEKPRIYLPPKPRPERDEFWRFGWVTLALLLFEVVALVVVVVLIAVV